MQSVVYIDTLVVGNFFMNFFLLYTINRFCKLNAKGWRIAVAAFAGALYVIVIFFPDLKATYSVIVKFMVSLLMIVISFSPDKLRDFIKVTILFYIEAFLVGGVIFGCFYLSNRQIESMNGTFLINHITANFIIGGSIGAILIVKIGFDFFENYYRGERNKINLQIILENRTCTVTALVDTGNSLKDPLTNEPIIVVYTKFLHDLMPEEINNSNLIEDDSANLYNTIMSSSLKNRIRLIPFRALGVESGMLTGIKVDTVVAMYKGKAKVIANPVIALYNKPFSSSGDYGALAYPGIV